MLFNLLFTSIHKIFSMLHLEMMRKTITLITKPSCFWALAKALAFCLYQLVNIFIQPQRGERVTGKCLLNGEVKRKVTCRSTIQPCSESTAWLQAPRSWHTWRAPALPGLGSSTPLLAYQHICQLVVVRFLTRYRKPTVKSWNTGTCAMQKMQQSSYGIECGKRRLRQTSFVVGLSVAIINTCMHY